MPKTILAVLGYGVMLGIVWMSDLPFVDFAFLASGIYIASFTILAWLAGVLTNTPVVPIGLLAISASLMAHPIRETTVGLALDMLGVIGVFAIAFSLRGKEQHAQ